MNFKDFGNKMLAQNKIATTIWFGFVAIALLLALYNHNLNNFIIFRQSYFHLIHETNLYVEYISQYWDHYYFSPSFAVLVSPFSYLPTQMGAFAWGILDAGILYYAIRQLPINAQKQNFIIILSTNEMMNAAYNFQNNGIMAATIILSFVFILKQKEFISTAMMMLGFFIKFYSITGLAFFFFSKHKKTLFLFFLFWLVVFILIPLLTTSPTFLIQSYKDWSEALALNSNLEVTKDMYHSMVDFTIQGMLKRVFNLSYISNWLFFIPGLLILGAQFLQNKYFTNHIYRLYILSSVMLFVIIFYTGIYNSGSASPIYIIGVPAICLWYVLQEKTKWNNILFIVSIFFSGFSYFDFFIPYSRNYVMMPYALKVVGCLIIWVVIAVQIFTRQFLKLSAQKQMS